MTRRAWLIVVAALVVVGVIVGVIVAVSGGGGSTPTHHPAAAPGSSKTHSSAPPHLPSICPALPNKLVAAKLHVPITSAVPKSTQFTQACTWHDHAGNPVLSLTTDTNPIRLLLDTLANFGAYKVKNIGAQTIFAPRPPRFGMNVHQTGVEIVIEQAGYQRLLPKGTTNPSRIPRDQVVGPLTAFGKAVVSYLH